MEREMERAWVQGSWWAPVAALVWGLFHGVVLVFAVEFLEWMEGR